MAVPEPTAISGNVLRGGQFFSPVAGQERHEHLVLTELWHPGAGRVPHHEHELAYVTLVLDGHYAEGGRHGWTELSPFSAIFNPAGVAHSSRVGDQGMKLFTIECRPRLLDELDLRLPDHPVVDPGSSADALARDVRVRGVQVGHRRCPHLESHLAEMLGTLAGPAPEQTAAPRWLGRVKDRLRAHFREPIRVRDLAVEAGVHPVHLARVFRARERQTPGEYVQRLRIREACELLRAEGATLAAVAADCGFSDQSHFTRTFTKLVGTSPGRFRKALRTAPADASLSDPKWPHKDMK